MEEEKALYERSTRRQVYLNLCVNAIKKLRDMTPQEMAISSPIKTETETRVAVTKTLPSGAVLISTKSPAKQEQPVMPASDDLTGVILYHILNIFARYWCQRSINDNFGAVFKHTCNIVFMCLCFVFQPMISH